MDSNGEPESGLILDTVGFALIVGLVVAGAVTAVVVSWEWLENPGGVFHGEAGTNWRNVFETLVSWFVPTFCYAAVIAALARVGWLIALRFRNRR